MTTSVRLLFPPHHHSDYHIQQHREGLDCMIVILYSFLLFDTFICSSFRIDRKSTTLFFFTISAADNLICVALLIFCSSSSLFAFISLFTVSVVFSSIFFVFSVIMIFKPSFISSSFNLFSSLSAL